MERGSQGLYWAPLVLLEDPGDVPPRLWVSVCPFVMWRKPVPAGMRGFCPQHRPARALFSGSPLQQAPLQPLGVWLPNPNLVSQFLSAEPDPGFWEAAAASRPARGGGPLSPPGPGPHFSSLITFPGGLHSPDGRMQFPHWSGRARQLRDQVSCWVQGSSLPRTRPQGSVRPTPASGHRQMHPPPPAPGHLDHAHLPQTLHPPSGLRRQPGAPNLPWLLHLSSPRPHAPLPVSVCENCTQSPRPSRDSPSSQRPQEPPLLPELGKLSPSSPIAPFSPWMAVELEWYAEVCPSVLTRPLSSPTSFPQDLYEVELLLSTPRVGGLCSLFVQDPASIDCADRKSVV